MPLGSSWSSAPPRYVEYTSAVPDGLIFVTTTSLTNSAPEGSGIPPTTGHSLVLPPAPSLAAPVM